MSLAFHSANNMLGVKRRMIFATHGRHHPFCHKTTTTTTNTIRTQLISRSQVKGILRKSVRSGRTSHSSKPRKRTVVDRLDVLKFYLWKLFLIILVPLAGFMLSKIYPSSLLRHFLALCFVYRVIDVFDHDPVLCAPPSPLNSPRGGGIAGQQEQQSFRNRLVRFAEGTKFHRLPKPLSRKQKRTLIAGEKIQPSILRPTTTATKGGPTNGILAPIALERLSRHDVTQSRLDWEGTNRLLKSLINKHHDEGVTATLATTNSGYSIDGDENDNNENQHFDWSRIPCTSDSARIPSIIASEVEKSISTCSRSSRADFSSLEKVARSTTTKMVLKDSNHRL